MHSNVPEMIACTLCRILATTSQGPKTASQHKSLNTILPFITCFGSPDTFGRISPQTPGSYWSVHSISKSESYAYDISLILLLYSTYTTSDLIRHNPRMLHTTFLSPKKYWYTESFYTFLDWWLWKFSATKLCTSGTRFTPRATSWSTRFRL